jgi:hypothetical protein
MLERIANARKKALDRLRAEGLDETQANEMISTPEGVRVRLDPTVSDILSEAASEFRDEENLRLIATRLRKRIIDLNENDVRHFPLQQVKEPFNVSLGEKLTTWRDEFELLRYRKYLNENHGTSYKLISDEEYFSQRGRAPWEVLNEYFLKANFPYEISVPDPERGAPYLPKLIRKRDQVSIGFSQLSSGEQIILQLIMCSYSRSAEEAAIPPKLVLLDEVDSALHPSLAKEFIRVSEQVLSDEFDACVIATTHSPSTVAFAPEDSLFTLTEFDDGHRLEKVGKDAAIKVLTSGVPTLSLSYDGRRQVFCEDDSDRDLYTSLFAILSNRLGSARSLEFIGTGVRLKRPPEDLQSDDKDDDDTILTVNSGCQVVCTLVKTLVSSGNMSAFGIVDWDGGRSAGLKAHPNVVTIGKGARYAIENIVLDPLIVAALLVQQANAELLGLPRTTNIFDLAGMDQSQLQSIVDAVQTRTLGDATAAKIPADYLGGFTLSLDRRWLHMNGHALAQQVLASFRSLYDFNKGRSGSPEKRLLEEAVNSAIRHLPQFTPKELSDAFKDLLERD